jgi:primosomal protein N''
MANEGAPKSAIELAMERLRKKDEEAGITATPPTDAQKKQIAEVRSYYDAKIAEQQILQEAALRRVFDAAEREEVERQFRREKERLARERDAKAERIRAGDTPRGDP